MMEKKAEKKTKKKATKQAKKQTETRKATQPKKEVEKQTLTEELKGEMAKWQTKMDEAKVQMHLGAKEAQDKIQPHIDKLEQELGEAEKQWQQLENATESAWDDLRRGLKGSLKIMEKSFEKAQQHFHKEEKK
jgi:hypothetical protein